VLNTRSLAAEVTVSTVCMSPRASPPAVADPGFDKGGTMASAPSASLNGSLGAKLPGGSTGGCQGERLKASCTFLQKSDQKLRI